MGLWRTQPLRPESLATAGGWVSLWGRRRPMTERERLNGITEEITGAAFGRSQKQILRSAQNDMSSCAPRCLCG